MSLAGVYDFSIDQGSTVVVPIVWKDSDGSPIDLTGYTARMQLKTSYSASPALSLTSTSGISLTTTTGEITITMTATQTASLSAVTYLYDLELVSSAGVVTKLIKGQIQVLPEVTT